MTDLDVKQRAASVRLHHEIIRKIPFGMFVLQFHDPRDVKSGRIIAANPAALKFAGKTYERLRVERFADLPELAEAKLWERCQEVLRSGVSMDLGELSLNGDEMRPGDYSVHAFSLPANCVGVTLEDITARKAAENAIGRSDERFRLLIQGVRDYAIFMLDCNGYVLTWNEAAEHLNGYREEEILGKHFSVLYVPEDRQDGRPEKHLVEAVAKEQYEDEGWRLRKDGSRYWANVVMTVLRDAQGNLRGFAKVTRDMTRLREREEALRETNRELELHVKHRTAEILTVNEKLRAEVIERERATEQLHALAMYQQKIREDERTRVAREMHDELGQLCTALKMDLAWIARRLPEEQTRLREKAGSALTLVSNLIQSVRRLSAELRPSTLDSLGLAAAMEWQVQEFQSHTAIPCQVFLPEKELVLDQDRSTVIFRIFQETLTNVARHANATSVQANLVAGERNVVLVVHDNGKGFDASYAVNRGSPGLLGMMERARLVGGELKITSAPGRGTTVTVQVPLRPLN